MSFDNTNQIILSKVVSDNPNAPALRLRVELEGGAKKEAALWPMTRKDGSVVKDKNENTLYKGILEDDTFEPNQVASQDVTHGDIDSDIPF